MPLIPKTPPGVPPGYETDEEPSDEERVLFRKQVLEAVHRVQHLEAKLEPSDEEGDEGHEDKVSIDGDGEGDDGHEGKLSTGDECDEGHEGKVSLKWHPYLQQFVDVDGEVGLIDDDEGDEGHEGQVSMDDAGDEDHGGKVSMDGMDEEVRFDDGGVEAVKQELIAAMFADEVSDECMEEEAEVA